MADLTREKIKEWIVVFDDTPGSDLYITAAEIKELRTMCDMALRSLDGVVVPREVTKAMRDAFHIAYEKEGAKFQVAWEEMLAAASEQGGSDG